MVKMINKVKKIMRDRSRIRNIGTASHIDHGKCVSPETEIMLTTGEDIEARELYKKAKQRGELVRGSEEERVIELEEPLKVNSFDPESGEVVRGRIMKAWKLKKTEPLIEVKMKNGLKVRTTPEHKFLVLNEEEEFDFTRADQLETERRIVTARRRLQDPLALEELKGRILEKLAQEPKFYCRVKEELVEKIRLKSDSLEGVHDRINSVVGYRAFTQSFRTNKIRIRDLLRASKEVGIEVSKVYDSILEFNQRGTESRGVKSSNWLSLPKSRREFEHLYYLIGCYYGDGTSEGFFFNENQGFMDEVIEKFEIVFDFRPKVKKYNGRVPRLETGFKSFSRFMNVVFGFPEKSKSNNLEVPSIIKLAENELVSEFVSGLFDTDGTVEESRSAVSITSVSDDLLEGLQYLLMRFDIASKLNPKKRTLYVSGEWNVDQFKEIGFKLLGKESKFNELLSKASNNGELDRVGLNHEFLKRKLEESGETEILHRNYLEGYVGVSKYFMKELASRTESREVREWAGKIGKFDTVFSKVEEINKKNQEEFVYDFTVETFHNFIAQGVVVHNTTLSDSLLAGAGMLKEQLAGESRKLDFIEEEQQRGITIESANISMVHDFKDNKYLINLIDTPGHIDFGGEVTRAMRAVDGAIVLVCAVEGIMPQTETVLRQALEEKVKPILFINKVDRLISELKLGPKEMQNQFKTIIGNVNNLIRSYTPEGYGDKWKVNVDQGEVAFGSALHRWGISIPRMKETGISFKDIYDAYQKEGKEGQKMLYEKVPVHKTILDMVIKHLPSPLEAQEYRIPTIWKGDIESDVGQSMKKCDPEGDTVFMSTKIKIDEHGNEVAIGRLFSGTADEEETYHLNKAKRDERVQRILIYEGKKKRAIEKVPAGNIAGLSGMKHATAGETISMNKMQEFEAIEHAFEPVVTKAIEAKDPQELDSLIKALNGLEKEYPLTVNVDINEETGEHLLSGQGELHLEWLERKIQKYRGVEIETSEPIVVYRETVSKESPEVMGKSPNRHNKFFVKVEPLSEEIMKKMEEDEEIEEEQRVRKRDSETINRFKDMGMDRDEAEGIRQIYNNDMLVDMTTGIVHMKEVIEMIVKGFKEVMDEGPLAREKCRGVKVKIMDVKLHEDSIHRGPSQVIPAIRNATRNAFFNAEPYFLEPVQTIRIDTPNKYMGNVSKVIQGRRGKLLGANQKENFMIMEAKLPVAESFGFTDELRSKSKGRASWSLKDSEYQRLPQGLQYKTIQNIRKRKGMKELSKNLWK